MQDSLEQLVAASKAREGTAVCSMLTPNSIKGVERPLPNLLTRGMRPELRVEGKAPLPSGPGSCARVESHFPEFAIRVDVNQVTVHGSTATVHAATDLGGGNPVHANFVFRKLGGSWKLDLPRTLDTMQFPPGFD